VSLDASASFFPSALDLTAAAGLFDAVLGMVRAGALAALARHAPASSAFASAAAQLGQGLGQGQGQGQGRDMGALRQLAAPPFLFAHAAALASVPRLFDALLAARARHTGFPPVNDANFDRLEFFR
jgi:hypothetical protein